MRYLFLLITVASSLAWSQKPEPLTFMQAYDKYDALPLTSQAKVDSIIKYARPNFHNMPLDSLAMVEDLIYSKIEQYSSLRVEQHWMRLLSQILGANGAVGKTTVALDRRKQIAIELGDTSELMQVLGQETGIYYSNGLHEQALPSAWLRTRILDTFTDSAQISGNSWGIGWHLTNIGFALDSIPIQDSAVKYNLRSIEFSPRKVGGGNDNTFITALSIARSNKREEAIRFCLGFAESRDPEDLKTIGNRLLNMVGEQYSILDMPDSAFYYFDLAIDIGHEKMMSQPDNKHQRIQLMDGRYSNPGGLYQMMFAMIRAKKFKELAHITDQVLYNEMEGSYQSLIDNYRYFGMTAYHETGQYKKAAECYKAYLKQTEEDNKKKDEKLDEANKQFAESTLFIERERAEAAKLQQQKLLSAEEEKKKLQQKYFTAGITGIAIFFVILYSRFRKTRAQKAIIEKQKEEVDLAYGQLEEKNAEILDSIAYAKRIQSAILPPEKLVKEYLKNSFVLYKPKDVVAGDFYWMEHKDDKVLFAAADCTGHGVPGAMVSVICNGGLNRSVNEFGLSDPGKILDKTREIVIKEFEKSEEEVKDGMDIALCSLEFPGHGSLEGAVVQATEGDKMVNLQYAGAHNALWIIRRNENVIPDSDPESQVSESGVYTLEEIKADKQPIGKYAEEKPFTTHTLELSKGDTFYIFSDGYADQFGGDKGKKFKAANFKRLLLSMQNESMDNQKILLDQAFEEWRGSLEQVDDICVIGVRV